MKFGHFRWKLLYPYLILIVISLIFFGIATTYIFKEFYLTTINDDLKARTSLIREELQLLSTHSLDLGDIVMKYDLSSETRVTIILPNGKVIADSREDISKMDNHKDRPEVIEALIGLPGTSIRFSHTLNTDMMYVALPINDSEGKLKFVIRTALPLNKIDKPFTNIYGIIIVSGVIVILLAFVISTIISGHYSKPLGEIREAAECFAKGDLQKKIFPPKDNELRVIVDSLNTMATQLNERLTIISEQKNIQHAVFESMKEGVLAVDYDEKILLVNKEAEEILELNVPNLIGKTLQEVVRISEIQKFFSDIIHDGRQRETEIIVQREREKILQMNGTVLYDSEDKAIGVIVVLNDISNLKYLDTLKRDLVANVSHELRTPITTIKGFIETLREDGIDDKESTNRFLKIVSKNIDRLNLIIDDLLSLSRIEQSAEMKNISFKEEDIEYIILSVVEDYEHKAKEKQINIETKIDSKISANVNRLLLEQAIGNLVDNAIKYSDKKSKIRISASIENKELIIIIRDQGVGIDSEHFPRLFERFYRIEKSRSRDEGGTGLGLSIVKHIVNAHEGRIEVGSELGKGSIFTIFIPLLKF